MTTIEEKLSNLFLRISFRHNGLVMGHIVEKTIVGEKIYEIPYSFYGEFDDSHVVDDTMSFFKGCAENIYYNNTNLSTILLNCLGESAFYNTFSDVNECNDYLEIGDVVFGKEYVSKMFAHHHCAKCGKGYAYGYVHTSHKTTRQNDDCSFSCVNQNHTLSHPCSYCCDDNGDELCIEYTIIKKTAPTQ